MYKLNGYGKLLFFSNNGLILCLSCLKPVICLKKGPTKLVNLMADGI